MAGARAVFASFAVALVVAACLAPVPARAASLADLRAQAQSAGLSPGSGGAGEQAALDRLGRIALAFLDVAESGDAGAVSTYEAIAGPLERSYDAHRRALDRMSQSVIDADGDMDAMAESPAYREHQALAAQALYYLQLAALPRRAALRLGEGAEAPRRGGGGFRRVRDRPERQSDRRREQARARARLSRARPGGLGDR